MDPEASMSTHRPVGTAKMGALLGAEGQGRGAEDKEEPIPRSASPLCVHRAASLPKAMRKAAQQGTCLLHTAQLEEGRFRATGSPQLPSSSRTGATGEKRKYSESMVLEMRSSCSAGPH